MGLANIMGKKISMFRKLLGYSSGDRKQPIYAPMPGALVTAALIHCSQCRTMISGSMGPRRDAWCISCTDENVKIVAKGKKAARKKAAIETARKKAEAYAEKKAENKGLE